MKYSVTGKILESLSASIGDKGTALLFKNRNSPKSEPPTPPRSPNSSLSVRTTVTPNSITTQTSKMKSDISLPKQSGSRTQSSIFSSTGVSFIFFIFYTCINHTEMRYMLRDQCARKVQLAV